MFYKLWYNFKLIVLFLGTIFLLWWSIYAQAVEDIAGSWLDNHHPTENITVSTNKDIETNSTQVEKKDESKITKKDLINIISTDENAKKVEEKDKEIDNLKNEVSEIKNTHINITSVESKIKEEIKKLEEQIRQANASWQLKEEVDMLQNELNIKRGVVEELIQERARLELKEVELNQVKQELEKVKEEYQKKVDESREQKIKYILLSVLLLIAYIVLTRILKKNIKISPENEIKVKTIIGIIDSLIFTSIIIYLVVEVVSIYKQFVYIIMIALSWLLLAFKEYILSFFAFLIKILFTYKVGDTIEIEKKIAKIKNIWIIFMELELYTKELVPIWNRTYFNQSILLNSSAFNISELGYENEYDFHINKEHFTSWMVNDDYNLLWLIEEICKLNTVSTTATMDELSKKLFLFYHIKIKTDKDTVIIAINTKTLSNKSQEIYKFISSINQIIEITSSKQGGKGETKIEIS